MTLLVEHVVNETPRPPSCETCSLCCDAQCASNSPTACETRGSLLQNRLSTPLRLEQSLPSMFPKASTHVALQALSPVLHGESSKRLASPRNTTDRKHIQSTQTTVNRHNSQTMHLAVSKGQPGSQGTQHQSAQQPCTPSAQQPCTPSAQQPPAIITHTKLGVR